MADFDTSAKAVPASQPVNSASVNTDVTQVSVPAADRTAAYQHAAAINTEQLGTAGRSYGGKRQVERDPHKRWNEPNPNQDKDKMLNALDEIRKQDGKTPVERDPYRRWSEPNLNQDKDKMLDAVDEIRKQDGKTPVERDPFKRWNEPNPSRDKDKMLDALDELRKQDENPRG